MAHPMKPLEDKLTELLAECLDINLIEAAMIATPGVRELDGGTFYALRDALLSEVETGGIQVIVKLPSSKALAKQRRDAKVRK